MKTFNLLIKSSVLIILALCASNIAISQTWTHDFETAGGYTTSIPECTDNSDDYFIRTDGSNVNDDPTGIQGSFYFGAQDIDGAPCTGPSGNATILFDDINISGCSGMSLEVWAAQFNGSGWDNSDYVRITYDIDNSGTFNNLIWFENDGATFNTSGQQDTDFDGTGDGTVLTGAFQNFTGTITGTGALIDIQVEFQLNAGSEDISLDNFRLFGTGCGAPPTSITTTTVSAPPFDVECATPSDASGTVDFTSTGTFTGGNIYTAQLSDASGSFASPTDIGTLTSTANSGTINITIPAATATGAGYVIRVISDSPVTTGSSSAAFTITQNAPCLPSLPATGLIINEWSNGPSGNQEYYEFVVAGECGETVDIREYILDDNNATFTTPADYDGTASGIAPGHFRFTNDAQWANIPVGSVIVIYNADDPNADLPADDPTDSDNDSLYVVPHTSTLFERCTTLPVSSAPDSVYTPCTYATAPLTGWGALSLRNSGDAIQVRLPNGDYYHGVSYGGSEISGGPDDLKLFTGSGSGDAGWFNDGDPFDVSNWSSGTVAGNQTPGAANNATNAAWLLLMRDSTTVNCPITVLPVEIGDFQGQNAPEGNLLYWYTLSERDADYFLIERSTDGKNWKEIGTIKAVGNSTEINNYQLIDVSFASDIHYYRLVQFDTDGSKTKHTRVVSIDNREKEGVEMVGIYNLLGQKVDANFKGVQIRLFSDGSTQRVYKN